MRSISIDAPSRSRWLTHAAFFVALVIVIARMTTVDALRDPWDPTPGGILSSHGPGPAAAVVYDLIMMIPAILVLGRRSIDAGFRLTPRWSHLPMFLLAGWAVLSTLWSADKFAAAVTSFHLLASACLLWAMSQLVRSWVRFRLVAAVSFGLLLLMVAQSLMYRFIDVPENQAFWNERKGEILKQHGWEPDSFSAKQFEMKITKGETAGFFTSPNTLAATTVLLFLACVGIGIQKVMDREDPMWLVVPIIAAIALIGILIEAASKTSAATPFVGCGVIALFLGLRGAIRRQPVAAFTIGAGAVGIVLAGIVALGVHQHGLFAGHFSNSLDFRWKYWVASTGVFKTHPIAGTGWSNFGLHYLAHRLAEASEEIKDPHNFLVRFFVELGVVGGVLLIAWLLRLAWELTRPGESVGEQLTDYHHEDGTADNPVTISVPAAAVIVGMLISTIASTDLNQAFLDTLELLLRPLLLFLALLLGTVAASMRSPQSWVLDNRPAPWIFYCLVVGLGLFLLHNLIDFSWFEPGPMAMFMLLIGASLGMTPAKQHAPHRVISVISTGVAAILWIAAAVVFAGPVIIAEEAANDANDSITSAPAEQSGATANHYHDAAGQLATAASAVPYNADYFRRQANAAVGYGDLALAESLVRRAQQINPMYIDAFMLDANLQLKGETRPDVNRIRADFDAILSLNPNDLSIHEQYGRVLDRFGKRADAAHQYELALRANAALPEGEPRRLTPDKLKELKDRLRDDKY